jgi:CRP/FNR family cyclic AMP-dependent transcriptional regulator
MRVKVLKLSRGRSVGKMSVVDEHPRSATVRARSKSNLLILSSSALESILNEYPQTGMRILKSLVRLFCMNLRKTSIQRADFMLPDV